MDPVPRLPISPDSVTVLAQEPSQTYKVLAIVSVSLNAGRGSLAQLSRGLAEQAGLLGGNGILIGPESVSETDESRRMIGRVILFDSLTPPLQPALRVRTRTTAIVMWSILGGSLVAAGVYALVAPGSEPINPYDFPPFP